MPQLADSLGQRLSETARGSSLPGRKPALAEDIISRHDVFDLGEVTNHR